MPAEPRSRRAPLSAMRRGRLARREQVSLAETLDRVLNKGAVIAGDITISVADIDLVYLGLNLVVASVETMRQWDRHTVACKPGTCEPGAEPLTPDTGVAGE